MFIRYTCSGGACYFYDKNKELIKPLGESKYWAFAITNVDIEFFNFNPSSKEFYKLSEYKLNENYSFENKKIKFKLSTILRKEQESLYKYKDESLFESLEAPNILPNNNDSIFREEYYKNNKTENIYLSRYDLDYYPVLSVSPPNFVFEEKKYQYTSDGEASKLYEAFRNEKIPNTLFLKPHCRQWNTGKVILTTPGEYNCTYNYNTRELTMKWTTYDDSGNSVEKTKTYNDVPHVITICCQGAGSGGEDGHPASFSGNGGSAGGFIAGNCFLGEDVKTFRITVGKGGKSNSGDGGSSIVTINQAIDLTNSKNKKNPTFISYNGFEYTTLECMLSFVAKGGVMYVGGNGKVSSYVNGSYQDGDTIKTDQNSKSRYFLSSPFYKILFDAKGGKGGRGVYGKADKDEKLNAKGSGAYFTTITDSTWWPNIKAEWSSNNTYSLEGKIHIHGSNNLNSPLILGGSSLQESLYSEDIYPSFIGGGPAGSFDHTAHPGGAGGGSSLFGVGGSGGSRGQENGRDGKLGAGGGGGKGGIEPGNGGKGGDGAVWLLW